MRLTIFRSDKGDCLLLDDGAGDDARRVLIDGGMAGSYSAHVAEAVSKLPALDLIYVSHIDQDHISGVLRLLDDEAAWRVYEYRRGRGLKAREPKAPRPPKIGAIWHNAFQAQLAGSAAAVSDMLGTAGTALSASAAPADRALASHMLGIATSEREAIRVSRRIDEKQLAVPLNEPAGGQLMMLQDPPVRLSLGGLRLTVIAPAQADLDALREEWDKWLAENQAAVRKLERKAEADERNMGALALARARSIGDRGEVTLPNLASLMLLAEATVGGEKRAVLLTGDGHADDVLRGLEAVGALTPGGGLHVDALKVPHHGSEHNTTDEFCRRVTADHYLFCGDGADGNPDLRVIDAYARSRAGKPEERSPNPEAGGRFAFWFSATDGAGEAGGRAEHMRKVRGRIESWRADGAKLRARFMPRKKSFQQLKL